jgi:hypothetical protein
MNRRERARTQKNSNQIDESKLNTRSWDLTNRWAAKLFKIDWSKQNPNPKDGDGSCLIETRVGRDPLDSPLLVSHNVHGPRAEKWWCSTKIYSGRDRILMIPVNSKEVLAWDQIHFKDRLLFFPCIYITSKTEPRWDLGVQISVYWSWTPRPSWTRSGLGL